MPRDNNRDELKEIFLFPKSVLLEKGIFASSEQSGKYVLYIPRNIYTSKYSELFQNYRIDLSLSHDEIFETVMRIISINGEQL